MRNKKIKEMKKGVLTWFVLGLGRKLKNGDNKDTAFVLWKDIQEELDEELDRVLKLFDL